MQLFTCWSHISENQGWQRKTRDVASMPVTMAGPWLGKDDPPLWMRRPRGGSESWTREDREWAWVGSAVMYQRKEGAIDAGSPPHKCRLSSALTRQLKEGYNRQEISLIRERQEALKGKGQRTPLQRKTAQADKMDAFQHAPSSQQPSKGVGLS